ncbi:MAG: Sec-independent protein translocase protein TatB [Burkholderiales bacterium]|jgi:sec-independent protein translocase protein TatB|nr:Sec-independent protein translocase protein TatB [Burkholderiales bacterium]
MFDISFSEMLVIAVVAVVVVGPKRLPKTVRTIAHLLGRAQRYVSDIKSDIEREIQIEEIRNLKNSVDGLGKELTSTARAAVGDVEKSVTEVKDSLSSMKSDMETVAKDQDIPGAGNPSEKKQSRDETEKPGVPSALKGEVSLSIPDAPADHPDKRSTQSDTATPTST